MSPWQPQARPQPAPGRSLQPGPARRQNGRNRPCRDCRPPAATPRSGACREERERDANVFIAHDARRPVACQDDAAAIVGVEVGRRSLLEHRQADCALVFIETGADQLIGKTAPLVERAGLAIITGRNGTRITATNQRTQRGVGAAAMAAWIAIMGSSILSVVNTATAANSSVVSLVGAWSSAI